MLARKLKSRHLNMIALGGSIGTGIFLASGYALHVAGPGGAVVAYGLIAVMVYFLITSLGEMATHDPISGSFCEYSSKYVSPSFGMAMSYNYWLNWTITISAEISAATALVQYWFPHMSFVLIASVLFALVFLCNFFSVKVYGESEYIMSFVKVSVIIVFIALCVFLLCHKASFGMSNLVISDGPFHHGFKGFLSVFLIAGFSFQGAELIGVSAGEAKDPQKNIPKSIKAVFWRLLLFYIVLTVCISLLIPFNTPSLANQSSIATSPFTLVFQQAFGKGFAANFINFVALIAVVSAANASLYSSTRTLFYMGQTNKVPRFFTKVSRHGVPLRAMIVTFIVGVSLFLLSYVGNGNVFETLLNVSSLCGFIAWFGIALSHYYFRKKELNNDTSSLVYRSPFYPYGPILAMILVCLVITGQVVTLPHHATFSEIIKLYGALILFVGIFAFTRLFVERKDPEIHHDDNTLVNPT